MSQEIIQHFRNFIPIDTKDEKEILNFFDLKTFGKKDFLIEQGHKCKHHYFVSSGCLIMFFLDEKGIEQTIQFAIENWWLTDYFAFEKQIETDFYIQSLEITNVVEINYTNQEKLLVKFPIFEKYFRIIYQKAYTASQIRSKYLSDFSREQFYHHFAHHFPSFTTRIPQHILASYLNMTPEYLSEIKKKSRS